MSDNRYSAAAAWWRRLQENRADRARLRRCASVIDAMQEPAAIDLFRTLGYTDPKRLPAAALAAAVLASVREAAPSRPSFPRAIGPTDMTKPETAAVKPLRFRRLMEAATPDEQLLSFRRAVGLLGGRAPLESLAEGLLNDHEERRLRWIFDYWNATERPAAAQDAA